MPTLVLVHGWGFGPDFWEALAPRLGPHRVVTVDLGHLGPAFPPELPAQGGVLVGHSMGFAWALRWRRFDAYVAINGFTRFTRADDFPDGLPARPLERMQRRFDEAPETVYGDFMRRCGVETPDPSRLRHTTLAEGLRFLAEADRRADLPANAPLLALAGGADPIAPPSLTRATFPGAALRWHDEAGHLLPRTHPEWCADHIRSFLEGLA